MEYSIFNCFCLYGFIFIGYIIRGDIMDLLHVSFRAFLSLVTLFLVTKIIGKKQVSQLSLFDYVIGISIGNFAAEMTINIDSDILFGTVAVLIYGVVAYLINVLTMKSIVLRRFFMGKPNMVIRDGVILEGGLKSVKFDINDLLEQCRSMGYFDVSEIAYALVEPDGKLSILPKAEYKPVTAKDMNIDVKDSSMCANVIIDGEIMEFNLKEIGKNKDWLLKKLKTLGKNYSDILLATVDSSGNLVTFLKNDLKANDMLE